ncbi:MAG: UdgX family uracil-DNA binding protein [Burkholderiales bacterium]
MPRPPHRGDGRLPHKAELDRCRRCDLGARATQAVPGEGPRHAPLMLVGEQPGDVEDQQGRPFVGPSGRLLRQLMAEAGIGERDAYITNAVKHFSFELRGKRRIHKTPAQREIAACHDWLEAEIAAVHPRVIVALGATALRALVGKAMTIAAAAAAAPRHASGAVIVATFHPSAVLRAPDPARKAAMRESLGAALTRALAMSRA